MKKKESQGKELSYAQITKKSNMNTHSNKIFWLCLIDRLFAIRKKIAFHNNDGSIDWNTRLLEY